MDNNRVIQAAWVGWGGGGGKGVDPYGGLFWKVLSIRESLISGFFLSLLHVEPCSMAGHIRT